MSISFAKLINKTIAVWCALLCATCFGQDNRNQLQKINNSQQNDLLVLKGIENYINGLKSLSASFSETTSRNNDVNKGYIYIKRECLNGKTVVKIDYKTGALLSASLNGRFLKLTNRKTRKSQTYSILTTPLYALLAGKLSFKDFSYTVLENSRQRVKVQIVYEKQTFNLTFRKNNNKVDKLLFWLVSSDKGWAEVVFDDKNYYENDLSKIPDSTFS